MDIRELTHADYGALGIAPLLEIPEPPPTLWLRGTLPPPSHKKLIVVGSRALSPYGRDMCTKLISGLKGYPVSIVSGLALGTDACAHEAALRAGLHTIAVPGSGLSDGAIAPRTNFALATAILAAGGALLSEHPPLTSARPPYFPSRNRIMVGLADAVLIIEAGERSGTLITARLAGEYNRDLLCVPHRATDPHGFGASVFLRIGATPVTRAEHVREALGLTDNPYTQELPLLSEDEQQLFDAAHAPLRQDRLIHVSKVPLVRAHQALASLELKGLLRQRYGKWERVS